MVEITKAYSPERKTWQYRALAFTHGNQSQLGAFLIAMLGRKVKPPCFHPGGCIIKLNGNVVVLYKRDQHSPWAIEMVWHVSDMVTQFRGLAEVLKFSDDERVAMFDELKKWIVRDERALSHLD